MIKASKIIKTYGNLEVLKGVNLEIKAGEVVSIVGDSGAGKTTLLQILGTLDKATSGSLFIKGTNINKLSKSELSVFRNQNIGFIFQFHHLLPEFTALENVCIPAFIAKVDRKTAESRAIDLLKLLGVDHRMQHKPGEMSGGEQQRVAVARALINQPSIVLADEPSGNLDSENAASLHRLFIDLRNELGQTFVIVTHNEELSRISDRTIMMKDGHIVSGQ